MARAAIKNDILSTARLLFNKQGYDHVTMRQIAQELHIGVGNLTYHFAHKQDIVNALMDESFTLVRPTEAVESLAQVDRLLSQMLDTLRQNTFFFLDSGFDLDPRHQQHNGYLRACLLDGLYTLANRGIFLPSFTPEKQQQILDLLLMTHLTWLRLTVRGNGRMTKEALLDGHWAVLEPYLSPLGIAELSKMKGRPPRA